MAHFYPPHIPTNDPCYDGVQFFDHEDAAAAAQAHDVLEPLLEE